MDLFSVDATNHLHCRICGLENISPESLIWTRKTHEDRKYFYCVDCGHSMEISKRMCRDCTRCYEEKLLEPQPFLTRNKEQLLWRKKGFSVECPGCWKETQMLTILRTHDRARIPYMTSKILLFDDCFVTL